MYCREYERAVVMRLGRLIEGGTKGPGLFFIMPCIDTFRIVSWFLSSKARQNVYQWDFVLTFCLQSTESDVQLCAIWANTYVWVVYSVHFFFFDGHAEPTAFSPAPTPPPPSPISSSAFQDILLWTDVLHLENKRPKMCHFSRIWSKGGRS